MKLIVRLLLRGIIAVFGGSLDRISSKFTPLSTTGADWPSCQGHVESSRSYWHEKGVTVLIGYSYSVSGEYYSGYFEKVFLSDAPADRLTSVLKEGHEVTIRYKHHKPGKSLLLEQDQPNLRLSQSL
jgi:Protein of unknown function (DUF3592)